MQDMQILMLIESLTGQSRFKSVNSVNNIQNSSVRWSAPPKYIFIYYHPPPHAQLPRQHVTENTKTDVFVCLLAHQEGKNTI